MWNRVGTRDDFPFAAQWLACTLPCRRFADTLAGACAWLGVDADRYAFIAMDLHHLLLAGLPAHSTGNRTNLHVSVNRLILFPKAMDADEYALKLTPASKSLGLVIRKAQWLGKGESKPITTAQILPGIDMSRPETQAIERVPVAPLPPSLPAASAAPAAIDEPALVAETLAVPAASDVPLPAAVIPAAAPPATLVHAKSFGTEHEHVVRFADRRYRVRGLEKNLAYEVLKVNLLVSRTAEAGDTDQETDVSGAVHVDTFDLYQARHRATFARCAAGELGVTEDVIKADLGKLLLALEAEQEKLIEVAQAPAAAGVVQIEDAEREAALALLRRSDLIERIASDFSRCGIVGERTNALVGYLAAISRKLDRPLALLIQSTSAAGKSSLMDAVLQLVPAEDRVVYSAMTGQSLFYMGEMDLKHKILAIAEEEGVHRASYALKLLQSEGELTIASTSKDPKTGKLVTDAYHVEGPVMIFSTTTAADLDEELQNRCLVLTVDESREQTSAIHAAQRARRTLEGLHAKAERARLLKLHQNAQRLIEPLPVLNPYAHQLTFINDRTRTRRDHEKYLTLIDVIALLHQHQRVLRTVQHAGSDAAVRRSDAGGHRACQRTGARSLRPLDRRAAAADAPAAVAGGADGHTEVSGPRYEPDAVSLQPPRGARVHALGRHAAEDPPRTPHRAGIPAGAPGWPRSVLRIRVAV